MVLLSTTGAVVVAGEDATEDSTEDSIKEAVELAGAELVVAIWLPLPPEPTGTVDEGWKSKVGMVLVSTASEAVGGAEAVDVVGTAVSDCFASLVVGGVSRALVADESTGTVEDGWKSKVGIVFVSIAVPVATSDPALLTSDPSPEVATMMASDAVAALAF